MTTTGKSIDLSNWITKLSEQRYVEVSRGHRTFAWNDNMIKNSEVIGFNKITHLYKPLAMTNNEVVLRSEKSRIYIFHILPIYSEVIWRMKISDKKNFFRCSVEVIIHNKILLFLSYLQLNYFFLKRHVENETKGYLNDILGQSAE